PLVASYWAEMMRERYEEFLITHRDRLLKGLTDTGLGQAVFGSFEGGDLRLYLVVLRYGLPPEVSGPMVFAIFRQLHPDELPLIPFGDPVAVASVTEFLADTTKRSKILNDGFNVAASGIVGDDADA